MNRARLLLLVTTLVVLGIAFVLGRGGRTLRLAAGSNADNDGATYIAQDVVVRQTGDDGKPNYELRAKRVAQSSAESAVAAHELTVQYEPRGEQGQPLPDRAWTLSAANAQLPQDGTNLQLRGSVVASGRPTAASPAVTLRTESLDYSPQSHELNTLDPVQFLWGKQLIEARGLSANLALGWVELQAEVHGHISP